MSKYVGETEANINALLDALEGRRAILQIEPIREAFVEFWNATIAEGGSLW